jgi:hypothetical protein
MADKEPRMNRGIATDIHGGMTPSHLDVIESANARSEKRHMTRGTEYPDEKTLPSSGGETLDKDGVQDSGYLDKKGTPHGVTAFFNSLPPGTDIDSQELAHIEPMPMRVYGGGTSFPTDGGFPSMAKNPGGMKS